VGASARHDITACFRAPLVKGLATPAAFRFPLSGFGAAKQSEHNSRLRDAGQRFCRRPETRKRKVLAFFGPKTAVFGHGGLDLREDMMYI
jgi:hypothetical protein